MGYGKGTKGGRPRGTSHYPYREDEEREQVCARIEKGQTNEEIAAQLGWSVLEVRDTRARFYPTKGLAERYLRANALRLAVRVVEESSVEEAVDILSRPNIGVLSPAVKGATGPTIGIFTNISMDSLGGIAPSTVTVRELPPAKDDRPVVDVAPVEERPVTGPVPVPKPAPLVIHTKKRPKVAKIVKNQSRHPHQKR